MVFAISGFLVKLGAPAPTIVGTPGRPSHFFAGIGPPALCGATRRRSSRRCRSVQSLYDHQADEPDDWQRIERACGRKRPADMRSGEYHSGELFRATIRKTL